MYGLSNVIFREFINPLKKVDLFKGLWLFMCIIYVVWWLYALMMMDFCVLLCVCGNILSGCVIGKINCVVCGFGFIRFSWP